jgi:hypothetical protein
LCAVRIGSMKDDRKGMPVAALVLVAVLVLLPVLYVLAAGPMSMLFNQGYIAPDSTLGYCLEVIYWPLGVCADRCQPLASFLEWYVNACGGM